MEIVIPSLEEVYTDDTIEAVRALQSRGCTLDQAIAGALFVDGVPHQEHIDLVKNVKACFTASTLSQSVMGHLLN